MAVLYNGANGPFRGKVGSVVGSSWRNIYYIKGLQKKRPKRPGTPEQVLQREKFRHLVSFFAPLSWLLDKSLQPFALKQTGTNAAFQLNYDHAFLRDEQGELTLNYPQLQFSHGSLFTAGAERARLEDDTLHVSWNHKTYGMGESTDDLAYLLVYNEKQQAFYGSTEESTRGQGTVQIKERGFLGGGDLHVWLFFSDSMGKRFSKTVYVPLSIPDSDG